MNLDSSNVKFLVVHCSASKPSMKVDAKVIDRWHRQRGFLGLGYHFVINRNGLVEKGRPITQPGAHAKGFNEKSIGVCLVGGLDEEGKSEDNFTDDQHAALAELLGELLIQFPKAQILGHRDLPGVKKDCPCFDVRKWWHDTVENVNTF